jgi:hypothetical protein
VTLEQSVKQTTCAAAGTRLLSVIVLGIVASVVALDLGVGSYKIIAALAGSGAGPFDYVRALAPLYISILPAALFVAALAKLSHALKEFEAGRFFAPSSCRAVRQAGVDAAWALVAKVVMVPTLLVWVRREGGSFAWNFELSDLALAAFLVFVAAVGRVLEIAAAVQAENDAIV